MRHIGALEAEKWSAFFKNFLCVLTNCGKFFGTILYLEPQYAVVEYLGIPYAQPPVGYLRFSNPRDPYCNREDFFIYEKYSHSCPQLGNTFTNNVHDIHYVSNTNVSEDCLYLNIWMPKHGRKNKNLPVLVFFHDGDFLKGSANLEIYNGSFLALKTHSIVVTVNYRLNVFGFAQSIGGYYIPGNMGLKDQQMALRWVHSHISSFGGDRDKVTIFGIRSGAASVMAHMFSRESFAYYKGAILFSGHMSNVKYSKPYKKIQKYTDELIERLGCMRKYNYHLEVKCLRRKSTTEILRVAEEIYNKMKDYEFGSPFSISTMDSTFFKSNWTNEFLSQRFYFPNFNTYSHVLMGHAANEGALDLLNYYYKDVMVYNATKKRYELQINKKAYRKILDDVEKKIDLKYVKRQVLNKTYADYSKKAHKVMALLTDLFSDCDLKKFSYGSMTLKKFSHAFILNKTSSIKSRQTFSWLKATSLELIEYIFGNPFRHPEDYHEDKIMEEKNFSENVMKIIGYFIRDYKVDKKWDHSGFFVFRERMVNKSFHPNEFKIVESNIFPNACKLFSGINPKDIYNTSKT
uniref:acetylcholinesterase n=1 Tax=Parastrongyloides trichosuri TaxID=131310 RepID=A0A0N4ZI19_PARTI